MIEDARGSIDYEQDGTGPTIVFVPSSWGTRSAWRGVIEALRGRFRIVTTSLLGYGGTVDRRTAADPSMARSMEILSRIMPNASLATVAGAGHFMNLTHAAQVAKLIDEHFAKVERVPRGAPLVGGVPTQGGPAPLSDRGASA